MNIITYITGIAIIYFYSNSIYGSTSIGNSTSISNSMSVVISISNNNTLTFSTVMIHHQELCVLGLRVLFLSKL